MNGPDAVQFEELPMDAGVVQVRPERPLVGAVNAYTTMWGYMAPGKRIDEIGPFFSTSGKANAWADKHRADGHMVCFALDRQETKVLQVIEFQNGYVVSEHANLKEIPSRQYEDAVKPRSKPAERTTDAPAAYPARKPNANGNRKPQPAPNKRGPAKPAPEADSEELGGEGAE